ncbi:TonB-dependent receptor [Sphingomonas sp. 8AM]|uniref:TonB-dependent receptor n=1 Tax=Sphingomonas sp. 8AM TaxID=2653170 RepID=UPI001F2F5808|nr:TonB-dependent receptor [Sphingomonas sp. 8AM]
MLATVPVFVAAIPSAAAGQAVGQAAGPADGAGDDVVVTGYRKSLGLARDIKKAANIQKDVIVAEDMAKFPELNLAESLQRVPGVQITREAGEGRRISLRGLGPDFSRVQLNGMEVLGNVDSAQDSRGQRTRDRAFDFNIFASELFSRVEVEKTFQAAQKEGGMAGTVGLFTGRPFDYAPGIKGALVGRLGSNQYTKDAQPRVAALLGRNWDNRFGILISAAYSQRETTEQGHNTYNYSQLGKTEFVNGVATGDAPDLIKSGLDISRLSAAKQARFMAGDLYFADGNRISSWNARQERLGITASVQWRPADNLLLTVDGLYGQLTTHRQELHLATRPLNGFGSTTLDGAKGSPWPSFFNKGASLNDFTVDDSNYVTRTDAGNVTLGSENRRSLNKTRFRSLELTGEWTASDRLTIDGHAGYQKSTYKTPYDDKLYMRAKGNLIADYGTDGRSASFSYPGTDLTNASIYAMDSFYYRAFDNGSELREGVANARYVLNDALTLRAGAAYHRFRQDGQEVYYDSDVNGTTAKTRGTAVGDITSVFGNGIGTWLIGDYARSFARYNEYHRLVPNRDGSGGMLYDVENVYTLTEETGSGYVQIDWDTALFGKQLRGNVGARGYHTRTQSTGWIQNDDYGYLGTTAVEGRYSGVLPALNAVLEFCPELLVRFAATQNLNRPGLSSIAAQGSALRNDAGEITASRGNPNLKPYKDTTLDLSAEYYFGKVGLLSASVFQKWVTNFIQGDSRTNVRFGDTGVPFTTIPGATADTKVKEFTIPVNVAGTKSLTGIELAAQAQLSFLPAPFDGFGMVANYTYVDVPKDITGISKGSYNATLYYETDRFGARASVSHRTRFFTGRAEEVMDAGTRGFEATTYLDASAFVNLTGKLQLTLNAINLTNQKDTQFWGQNRYLYNQNQSGTTYMAGFSFKF